MSQVKTLWVREPYLAQILAGRKTIEVRVAYDNIRRLRPGDRLKLNDEHLVTIRRIGWYDSFDDLLAGEDPAAIAPDLPPAELAGALKGIYPYEKESLGVAALELKLPRRYDAILFDMGNTLVFFDPPEATVFQNALREIGIEREPDQIQAAVQVVWGEYYREAATRTFPPTVEYDRQSESARARAFLAELGCGESQELVQRFEDALNSWFRRPGAIRPYPEVGAVLETLKMRGYRLGIVSNWSWHLRARVAQVGLTSYFEVVWASAYAGCHKPHPRIFHQALAQLQVPLDRALHVGDSYEQDVIGARNAGIEVAWLDRAGRAGGGNGPVIRDLWELFGLLGE